MAEEKLKKASDAEKLKEEEKKRIISGKNEKMKAIITDIKKELVRLEDILPMNIEKPDNIPISPNGPFFLFKKRNEKKLKVIMYESQLPRAKAPWFSLTLNPCLHKKSGNDVKKVVTEQTIDDFMESSYYAIYPWGGEDALLQLRDRIPDFIEYLNTQV